MSIKYNSVKARYNAYNSVKARFQTRRITRVHLRNRGQEVDDDELMLNVLRCQLTY